ncbi:MAG TPA: MFS transporter [Actinobacteria bacterium]|nr:MFS transporter [Actinomycetota bacterium]
MSAAPTGHAPSTPKLIALAVPFLGVMGAIQGSAPNINSTALVSLTRDLNMGGGDVALAASLQTIAIAASVITTGLLADRLGRRKVLLAALIVGAAGSAVSGLAPASSIYFLGQILTGVGLGAVYGAAFGYIHAVAKPGKLAAALGVFGATIGLTTLIITFLGGTLVGVSWRLGFFVITVFSVICFFLVPWILPKIATIKNASLDIVGQILLAVGLIGFLYGVSQLGKSLTAPATLVPLVAGAIVLAAFFVFESKSKGAFYPVSLFKSPVFIAAILAGFVYNYGTAVAFLQSTNLWQYVTGVSTKDVAMWQVPLVAAGIIGALLTGRQMAKGMSNRTALLIGTVMSVVGFVLLAVVSSQKSFLAFLPGSILAGAGVVIVSIPFGNLIIKEAPPAQYGPVTSSRTTIGQFWYSIGFAISTVLVDKLTMGGVTSKLTEAGVQPDMISTATSSITQYVKTGDEPTTQIGKEALADAASSYGSAYTTVMLISAALMLLAGMVAVLLLRKAHSAAEGPAKTDPTSQLATVAAPASAGASSADASSSGPSASSPTNPSKE